MDTNTIKDNIKGIVNDAVPGVTVTNVEAMEFHGLHQMYVASTHDETRFICSLPPLPNRRVLKCEYTSIRAEAALLQWITSLGEKQYSESSPKLHCAAASDDNVELKSESQAHLLSKFVPKLVEYGSTALPHRISYNIVTCLPGQTISTLSNPLNVLERRSVSFQVGQLIRRISFLSSPTGRYGNAESMMPPVPAKSNWAQRRTVAQHSSMTYTRWSEAFADMVNVAIKDAQINHITASYEGIRRSLRRHTSVLDLVTEPRLVIIDAGLDHTVLIRRIQESNLEPNHDKIGTFSTKESFVSTVQVTGVREWIKSVFGDPLLAAAFCSNQKESIFEGFNQPSDSIPSSCDEASDSLPNCSHDVRIRLLLYQMYHALNAITVEYLRRDNGSDPREMQARKALLEALRGLDSIEDLEVLKRPRDQIEASPAKRVKTGASAENG